MARRTRSEGFAGTSEKTCGADDGQTGDARAAHRPGPTTRRSVLQMGAGLAAMSGVRGSLAAPSVAGAPINVPRAPNIIVLMTDQERHHVHWPQGWADKNLPSLARLKRNGLYFKRAYTAACQCSPSRGLMVTGRFAPVNRVTQTFLWPGLPHQDRQPNIASLLREKAGYEVVWKGKWHLSYASNAAMGNGGEDWGPDDIAVMEKNWGWSGWNPPDAGNAIQEWESTPFGKFDGLRTLGGAGPNNDGRYVSGHDSADRGQTAGVGGESVVDFLKNRARKLDKPFCLFISLVNPHDIGVYPGAWMKPAAWIQAGYRRENFARLGIKLPDNYADDLSTKPKIQKRARDAYNKFAPLAGAQAREDYVNFYAYLHTVVDKHITTVLDTLEETGLMNDTIILRLADHGEGGLAHGMREKAYTVYEEMIHIPLIVHNPKLYPEPMETAAFYDHLNLLPTILDLAGVADAESYGIGKSIVPIIRDPSKTVQDHTIFSFDDLFFVPASAAGGHIRAVREGDWTYAVYFGLDGAGLEYELYNLKSDPGQMTNLVHGNPTRDTKREWARLHKILTERLVASANLPDSFGWPLQPALA
jgi:arylsulfatase A-like enzyme